MAVLPTVQGRAIPNAVRPIASISRAAAAAPANALAQIGDQMLEQEADAAAREADAKVSDRIRSLMYDPESGFMNLSGQDAVTGRQRTIEELNKLKSSAFEGLSNAATRKLRASVDRRVEGALNSIETHTSGARRVWLEGAADARIASAYQDALTGQTETALATIRAEVFGRADREGWSAEERSQRLGEATSKVYADQITALAASDPIRAMEYMRENQVNMLPSDVSRIETTLMPEMKRAVGRAAGREAALSGVSSEYLANIRAAESGGNDLARNPNSSATGRYQFTSGTWATLMQQYPNSGLTVDGRTNAEQQELAIRLFTRANAKTLEGAGIVPTNGNLYAAHFLGAGGAVRVLSADPAAEVESLVGQEVMRANPFLRGMTVADFSAWAARKGGGSDIGFSEEAKGVETLLDIADPIEREAALNEYNLRASVAEGQRKASLAAAQDAAFQMIEGGGSVDDLALSDRQALGQTAMTSLRNYEKSVRSGTPVETDDVTYYRLRQMQANDPQGFRSLNLLEYRDKLSDSDWQAMVNAQTKPASDVTAVAASTLMTTAKRQLEAAGFDSTPEPGSKDALRQASLQTRLLQWQDQVIASTGQAPSQTEIDQRIARELLPVVIDPSWRIATKSNLLDLSVDGDFSEEKLAGSSVEVLGRIYDSDEVKAVIDGMKGDGVPVTAGNLAEILMRHAERFGR